MSPRVGGKAMGAPAEGTGGGRGSRGPSGVAQGIQKKLEDVRS